MARRRDPTLDPNDIVLMDRDPDEDGYGCTHISLAYVGMPVKRLEEVEP